MDVSTAQLYDLLIEKGFEKTRVREALSEIATRDEVEEIAAVGFDRVRANIRADLAELETRVVTKILFWMFGQFIATVGTLAALHAMFA